MFIIAPAAFLRYFGGRQHADRAHDAIGAEPDTTQGETPQGGFAVPFFFARGYAAIAERATAAMRAEMQNPLMGLGAAWPDKNALHRLKIGHFMISRKGLFCAALLGKFARVSDEEGACDGGKAENPAG